MKKMASAGPLELGLLHTATGSWNLPLVLLLALAVGELVVGLLAGRPLVLPAVSAVPPPGAATRRDRLGDRG